MSISLLSRARTASTGRMARSGMLLDAANERYDMIRLPKHCLLEAVYLEKLGVYALDATLTVGLYNFDTNVHTADYFFTTGQAQVTTVNIIRSPSIARLAKGGFITITLVKGTSAVTASSRLFADYDVIT